MVLVNARSADLANAFPSDSMLEAMRQDSLARVHRADSLAQAAKAARAARRDSLAKSSPMLGGTPASAARSVKDSTP
jgi:hypothetical protein